MVFQKKQSARPLLYIGITWGIQNSLMGRLQPIQSKLWSLGIPMLVFFFFFGFLGPHPRHMEVPRRGVSFELLLPAYTTATAMQDPSHVCNLHHSSRTLNPPREAGIEPVTSWLPVGFGSSVPQWELHIRNF